MSFWGDEVLRERKDRPGELRTGPRVVAILAALAVVFVCAKATFAQEIYNPCWAQVECLDANVGGVPSSQPNRGLCDTQHCFEPGGGCPSGQGKCYTNPPPVPLTVTIGGSARVIDVGDYIAKVYNYGVSIAGII